MNDLADVSGSTGKIIDTVKKSPAGTKWAIGTELHLVNRLKHEHPEQEIHFLSPVVCMCATMYRIDLAHLCWSLDNLAAGTPVNIIEVDDDTARWSLVCLSGCCRSSKRLARYRPPFGSGEFHFVSRRFVFWLARFMAEEFDPYQAWLDIKPHERPLDHYRLLGLKRFEFDVTRIESAANERMALVRSFQTGPRGKYTQELLNRLAAAKLCLLNPATKANYDQSLVQSAHHGPNPNSKVAVSSDAESLPSGRFRPAIK